MVRTPAMGARSVWAHLQMTQEELSEKETSGRLGSTASGGRVVRAVLRTSNASGHVQA